MFARRGAFVFSAKETALLQNRHDALDESLKAVRQRVVHEVEAVGRLALEPVFDIVRDLLRSPNDYAMSAAARQLANQLPLRQAATPRVGKCRLKEPVIAVAGVGQRQVLGQARVEIELVRRDAQSAGKPRQAVVPGNLVDQ